MKKKKELTDWVEKRAQTVARHEDYLRSKDVAHILDLSPDDVIELARKGELEGTKNGRFWRFKVKDVKEYQKQKRKEEDEYFARVDRDRDAR
jgi:excisionase family DNA binding protein